LAGRGLFRSRGNGHEPGLFALPVEFIHPRRFQRNGGVPQLRQLVHQDSPLGLGRGDGLDLRCIGLCSLCLAGFGRLCCLIGGPVGVFGRCRQRLRCGGCCLRGIEGPAAAGRNGLQRRGLLQGFTIPGDERRQRRVQAAVAVQVAGELTHLFPGSVLCLQRGLGPGRGHVRGAPAVLEFYEGFAVGVVCLHCQGERGLLGAGSVRQDAFDGGDLVRRRSFIGLRSRDVLCRRNLRRRRTLDGQRWRCGRCLGGEDEGSGEYDGGTQHGGFQAGSGQTHSQYLAGVRLGERGLVAAQRAPLLIAQQSEAT
jgi:hypothetical protein